MLKRFVKASLLLWPENPNQEMVVYLAERAESLKKWSALHRQDMAR